MRQQAQRGESLQDLHPKVAAVDLPVGVQLDERLRCLLPDLGVLPLPDFVSPNRELAESIKPLHGALAWTLATLVVLHVAAALKHQFIDKDGLLNRMRPGR